MITNKEVSDHEYLSKMIDLAVIGNQVIDSKGIMLLDSAVFKQTKDGRSFVSMTLSDISGQKVTGRMFNVTKTEDMSNFIINHSGHLVFLEFTTDFGLGNLALNVTVLKAINPEYEKMVLTARRTLIFQNLDGVCAQLAKDIELLNSTTDINQILLSVEMVKDFARISISKIGGGMSGAIVEVLHKLIASCLAIGVKPKYIICFILTLYQEMMSSDDTMYDFGVLTFHAVILEFVSKNHSLSEDIKHMIMTYALMLGNNTTSMSPDAALVKSLFDLLCTNSNNNTALRTLPTGGAVTLGSITYIKEK